MSSFIPIKHIVYLFASHIWKSKDVITLKREVSDMQSVSNKCTVIELFAKEVSLFFHFPYEALRELMQSFVKG